MEQNKLEQFYCMKCKESRSSVATLESKETKRGKRWMFRGLCPECDTKMCKMTKAPENAEELKKKAKITTT